jgi:integrase/recombinase XerD
LPLHAIAVTKDAPKPVDLEEVLRQQSEQIATLTATLEKFARVIEVAFAGRGTVEVAKPVEPTPPARPVIDGADLWRSYVAALGERTWIANMLSMMRPALSHFWPSLITYRARYRSSPARLPVAGPDMPLELMSVHHWTAFRVAMRGRSATYRNLVLTRLKAFFAWAENEGRIPTHPLLKAKLEGKRPRRETTITEEQAAAILAAQPHPYFQATMALASHTGIRRDEVRTLRWDQVDLTTGRIRLSWTTTKSKKSRDVFVDPTDILMLYDLRAWTEEHRRDGVCDYLFPRPRKNLPLSKSCLGKWFREACDSTGVQAAPGDVRVHWHDATRHSFAQNFLDRGGDIRLLQKILGHASLATTLLYVHSNREDVKRGFEAMHSQGRKPPHRV